MSTHCFEDADHASEKVTTQSKTGILIIYNQAPVICLSKKHNLVKTLTFRSKFIALKLAVELLIALRYNLRIFLVPLKGSTDMLCENEAVFKNTSTPESVLRKKNHIIAYHKCKEAVSALVFHIAKSDTKTKMEDLFTKILGRTRRE